MRRLLGFGMVLMVAFMVSGCASVNMPQGGVFPGAAFSDGVYPSMKDSYTKFNFDSKDFEVLGTASGNGESINVLGLFSQGDNGYQQLLRDAKQKYPNMDALINFYWDTHYFRVLGVFTRVQNQVTATAIKYRRR